MNIELADFDGDMIAILNPDSVNGVGDCDTCKEEKAIIEIKATDGYDSVFVCLDCLIKALAASLSHT